MDEFGRLMGEYRLVSAHWTGTTVDLNGDKIGHNELLIEFENGLGYFEPSYKAVVQESYKGEFEKNKRPISFNMVFPYPEYEVEGGKPRFLGVGEGRQTMRTSNYALGQSFVLIQSFPGSAGTDGFQESITMTQVAINPLERGRFRFVVSCSLPEGLGDNLNLASHEIVYIYEKVN